MYRLFATVNLCSLAIIRMVLGAVFFMHGCQKMLGWFGGAGFERTMAGFTHSGIPAPFAFLAICAEFFGGLGLLLGLLGRIAAFGVMCNMLVAVATRHWQNGFFMNWAGNKAGEGYEFHLLVIGMCLAVILAGSGPLSVDRAIAEKTVNR